jgi:pantoate--beta-alanine ligase
MKIIKKVSDMRMLIKDLKKNGLTVGFVPTMGYLHDGHLSLVKNSKKENDFTIVSIFVNPTQFGPNEDLESYPRDFSRDSELLESLKVDCVFAPDVKEMYPNNFSTYVVPKDLTDVLCGARRPGHFRGVTTIVSKLFNIIQPDRAYFGQKDAQQFFVLKRMVRDLNFDIELRRIPIVREPDGLAMSSRNIYLTKEERKDAVLLYKSLKLAEEMIERGERDSKKIIFSMRSLISKSPHAKIDYVEIVDTTNLRPLDRISGEVLIALAVYFGKARLIDNTIVRLD